MRNMKDSKQSVSMPTSVKQKVGAWLLPRLPINRHVFRHIRAELNGMWARALHLFHPKYRMAVSALRRKRGIKANIGSGPFGQAGWVNIDMFPHDHVTLRADCRRNLPFADASCSGIHAEHFFEHLNHEDERHAFLNECFRCLAPGGVLRIVVPDAELFVAAYLSPGWDKFRAIAAVGDDPEKMFMTKMDALNHVFIQDFEHYGGYDERSLFAVLEEHGFREIYRRSFRTGCFPDGCIDRQQHQPYSLYVEAVR
jgi:predicted SAM-dependent methyltransferase